MSPVFTLLERKLVSFLASHCGWSDDAADGLFVPGSLLLSSPTASRLFPLFLLGGSMANMYAMVLARYAMFPQVKELGVRHLPPLVLLVSEGAPAQRLSQ